MSFEEMDKHLENLQPENIKFPEHLCKMCGKCCRAIIPEYSYEELVELANDGDEEAKVFIDFFKKYPTIDDARKVVPEHVDQILKILQTKEGFDISKVSFYYCSYITDDNLCSIYEERPNCCRRAPAHGWSLMPPGCGLEGWQFELREKQKKSIRYLKESLYELEQLSPDGKVPAKDISVQELKEIIEKKIRPWEKYGSLHW